MLLLSNSIWKQTDYTLTLSNIQIKIFPWVSEENEGKVVFNSFLLMWKGGHTTLWPLARMATGLPSWIIWEILMF